MSRDTQTLSLEAYVTQLNERFRSRPACAVLVHAINNDRIGPVALASSFGADSVVLIHMVAQLDRNVPVLFLDTRMLFQETLKYQRAVAADMGLNDIRVVRPDNEQLMARDTDHILHQTDQQACCNLRKIEPLTRVLAPFGGWITGRKRFQGERRAALEHFEVQDGRVKVNPLAQWRPEELRTYMLENHLPPHPLQEKGYSSIGCAPCTTPTHYGENSRAGRWRDTQKAECGIHFEDGKTVRERTKT